MSGTPQAGRGPTWAGWCGWCGHALVPAGLFDAAAPGSCPTCRRPLAPGYTAMALTALRALLSGTEPRRQLATLTAIAPHLHLTAPPEPAVPR